MAHVSMQMPTHEIQREGRMERRKGKGNQESILARGWMQLNLFHLLTCCLLRPLFVRLTNACMSKGKPFWLLM